MISIEEAAQKVKENFSSGGAPRGMRVPRERTDNQFINLNIFE
jgi:hypothetical protein